MKKDLPLNIIKNFQPKENKNIYLIRPEEGEGFLLHFSDIDTASKFHFRIVQFNDKDNKFLIEHAPTNADNNSKYAAWLTIKDLNTRFDSWLELISEFNQTETIFDDPIIKGFQEEYFEYFEIIEEDAESRPLKTSQILLLDHHLSEIDEKINEYVTDDNEEAIIEIKKDIENLRADLTKKPKKWVIKKLSLIWAKLTKQGTNILKEFLNEGKTQIIKQGIKLIIEQGDNILN